MDSKRKGSKRKPIAAFRRPRNSLGHLLWQAHRGWQRHLEASLEALGLIHAQFVLLTMIQYLESEGEKPSQSRLASFLRFEQMMVSQSLRALEERGYLRRQPHPDDPRANQIGLTKSGLLLASRAAAIAEAAEAKFFEALGAQRPALAEMLRATLDSNAPIQK